MVDILIMQVYMICKEVYFIIVMCKSVIRFTLQESIYGVINIERISDTHECVSVFVHLEEKQ